MEFSPGSAPTPTGHRDRSAAFNGLLSSTAEKTVWILPQRNFSADGCRSERGSWQKEEEEGEEEEEEEEEKDEEKGKKKENKTK